MTDDELYSIFMGTLVLTALAVIFLAIVGAIH